MKQLARRQAETMGWPILEPIAAEGIPRPVALSAQVCVAGAREHVNFRLPSKKVSRAHALFVADRDSIYLRDLASANHTYLNDEPIREAVLRNGDVIGLGPMTFRCQSGFDRPNEPQEHNAPPAELRLEADGSRFALTGRTALIGNRPDCDIHLSGDDIDPAHAVIYLREGRRYIRDLRSHSDTLVNDEPVQEVELQPGDRIQIGDAHLIYEKTTPSQEPSEIPLELDDLEPQPAAEAEAPIPLSAGEPLKAADKEDLPIPVDEFGLPATFDTPKQEAPAPPEDQPAKSHPEQAVETHEEPVPLAAETPPGDDPPASAPTDVPELEPGAPIIAPIPSAELEQTPVPAEHVEEPRIAHEDTSVPRSLESQPAAPGNNGHAASEEKLTELLGELAETVSKVQSTWEEIRSESAEHAGHAD